MAEGPMKTHGAGTLRGDDAGTEVMLAGWVNRRRDHGGVIFIDLRDSTGLVQVVLNPEDAPADEETLHGLRLEYCVSLTGTVRARPEGTVNPDLPTGTVEVVASSLVVLTRRCASNTDIWTCAGRRCRTIWSLGPGRSVPCAG